MKELYLEVAATGGITFRTGVSLRNYLLGLPYSKEQLIVCKLDTAQVMHIVEKLELKVLNKSSERIETDMLNIHIIPNIQELSEQTDFSIHNIYLNPLTDTYYDPFRGIPDLRAKIISAPKKLFLGSPIKMIEACRLAGELGFTLNVETWFNLYDNAQIIKHISPNMIRQEMEKILLLSAPSGAFKQLQEARILEYILPELAACETVIQSKRVGVRNVFEHIMFALDACEPSLDLRLTILFHDIAKPQTLQCGLDGTIHFFKHEIVGSDIAKTYLKYWGFSKELTHKVPHLILHHMFDADPRMLEKSVRRLIRKVGKEYIYDLLKVRRADRAGTSEKISMRKIKLLEQKIEKELRNAEPIYDDTSVPNAALGIVSIERGNKKDQATTGRKRKNIKPKEEL